MRAPVWLLLPALLAPAAGLAAPPSERLSDDQAKELARKALAETNPDTQRSALERLKKHVFRSTRAPQREYVLYAQGILEDLTNPTAIVFIAALVPQFIVPDRPQWPQFAIIGATMVGVDVMVMSCYALLATRFRPLLRDPRLLRLQNRLFGGLFVGAGAMLAASSR